MRDLIAEGRERLAALSESPCTDRAFDLALWAGQNLAEILAELEAQRERVNELAAKRNPDDEVLVEGTWFPPDDLPKILGKHMRSLAEEGRRTKSMYIELEQARARIAELEAAQRPPLGYEVVAKRPKRQDPNSFEYTTAGSIWPEREPVDNHRGWCEDAAAADPERYGTGMEYIVAELREVQS